MTCMHGVQEPGYRGGLPSFSDDELDSPRTEGFPLDPGNPYATSHPAATAAAVLPPPPLLAQPPEIQRSGEYTETCNDLRYPMHDPTMHAVIPKTVADSEDESLGVHICAAFTPALTLINRLYRYHTVCYYIVARSTRPENIVSCLQIVPCMCRR